MDPIPVRTIDSRPHAPQVAMEALAGTDIEDQLREWLRDLLPHPQVALKDTRAYWVYEMFVRLADELGAELTSLTMLRHPTEVVRSRDTAYLVRPERDLPPRAGDDQRRGVDELRLRDRARHPAPRTGLGALPRPAQRLARGHEPRRRPARPDLQRRPVLRRAPPRRRLHRLPGCSARGSPGTTSRSRPSCATSPTRSGSPSTSWSSAPTTTPRSPSSSGCARSTSTSTPSPRRCRRTSAPRSWSPYAARCAAKLDQKQARIDELRTKLEQSRTQDARTERAAPAGSRPSSGSSAACGARSPTLPRRRDRAGSARRSPPPGGPPGAISIA